MSWSAVQMEKEAWKHIKRCQSRNRTGQRVLEPKLGSRPDLLRLLT